MLFKLEESFIEKHKGERRVRIFGEESEIIEDRLTKISIENEKLEDVQEELDEEINLDDGDDNNTFENQENVDEQNDKVNEHDFAFPDTEVKIEHDTGKVTLRMDSRTDSISNEVTICKKDENEEEEQPYIIPAIAPRKKQQKNSKKKKEEKIKQKQKEQEELQSKINSNQSQFKRGQKSKLKKMKAKYKNQDEEERELRMQILKSAGSKTQENTVIDAGENEDEKKKKPHERGIAKLQLEAVEFDDTPANADVDMIDSLTGIPNDEDELLFAIPIIAPYQSLQNYQ